ncbi:hypothetical protein QE152_g7292 [Popillia japonica]|uniref:Uncharacterized protein n=1 Tax=Popillia japonica TaxID=7064 RepID=A0AAW1MF39_POPJA
MYSANLTSLLAKPVREKSINNLIQLEEAMIYKKFQLYVEKYSSIHRLLENGTSIYGRLWDLMSTRQSSYLINSIEDGVKMVKDFRNVVVIAGRETLFFDTQRFGPSHFHLSEKINTAYSAIAFQQGCPYIDNVNRILMAIFEGGILTKMTEDEYEKLGKLQTQQVKNNGKQLDITAESRKDIKIAEYDNKLKAINIKMLQGAFYLLFIGYFIAGTTLLLEILYAKQQDNLSRNHKQKFNCTTRVWRKFIRNVRIFIGRLKRGICRVFNEAIISTLDYME